MTYIFMIVGRISFFNDRTSAEIYTLSLHAALPIYKHHQLDGEYGGAHDCRIHSFASVSRVPDYASSPNASRIAAIREAEIGRADVQTPATVISRMPSSA